MGGKHLTQKEQCYIEKRLACNVSRYQIAKELGVSTSTVYREVERNTAVDFNKLYSCRRAVTLAQARRTDASSDKRFRQITDKVSQFIHDRLLVHTSPDVISGELRLKHKISVSENTIYRYIQHDKQMEGTLYKLLPHRGKPYNKRQLVSQRVKIVGRTGIEERPTVADFKQEPGHFEIDTIFGLELKSFLLTVVDKANKALIIRKLPIKRAETVVNAFSDIVGSTLHEFKTITSDNGSEFAQLSQIAEMTGADFYFAMPYHSWERGLNEHTNGLIRRFYPKGTDFNLVSDEDIAKLGHILNTRGRASLGYKSPNEAFMEHLLAA
ncbi:IS30 family transposase [uncultured Shewanella sp.]|uniref:IS30 family transposase n=1 Tax=uncultured Shewanella sp. TaxID=173975 RepID=UPI0026225FB0|nr:IS30 family transposase [uncultured Shewanella sp.]